jgi:hypothetical protein
MACPVEAELYNYNQNSIPVFSNASFIVLLSQIRSSDTSAESGSEVEEITSPKAAWSYLEPRLTPVREEVSVCN